MPTHEPVMAAETVELLDAVARRPVRGLHRGARRPHARAARGRRLPRARPRSRYDGARAGRRLAGGLWQTASSSCTPTTGSSARSSTHAASTASTARWRTSACRRCSSTRRGAGSASGATSRSTCGWIRRRARPPRTSWPRPAKTDLANVIFQYGEERFSRRIARRIVEARQAAADRHDRSARAHRPQRGPAQGLPADRPGDADVPGAAHLGQPRARGARRASCWRRRAGCAPGRGWR